MTCIAAIKDPNGDIHMGADSQISCGNDLHDAVEPKIFLRNAFLYGVAGPHRIHNILKHSFTEPPRHMHQDAMAYLVNDWVPAWMQCLDRHGQRKIENNLHSQDSAWILIAHDTRLFAVAYDLSVMEVWEPFYAMGSGSDIARGALNILCMIPNELDYHAKLSYAIGAAMRYNAGCGGMMHHLMLPNHNKALATENTKKRN